MGEIKIFCGYAPEDRKLKERFHSHLQAVLELQDVSIWYSQDIPPGKVRENELTSHLQVAHIILFLVSADFIASHEQYIKEVLPAMERHTGEEARVIPIILRPVHWQGTPFGKLRPLPDGGKPVADWKTPDHAFLNVVTGIKRAIAEVETPLPAQQESDKIPQRSPERSASTHTAAAAQLTQIIEQFKLLRGQITNYVYLRGPKGLTIDSCEKQYNKLYGDTMVFLAAYLPERISDDSEGFVETVYRKTTSDLHNRANLTVSFARFVLAPLAKIEKLTLQIDACIATLEFYKQKYQ